MSREFDQEKALWFLEKLRSEYSVDYAEEYANGIKRLETTTLGNIKVITEEQSYLYANMLAYLCLTSREIEQSICLSLGPLAVEHYSLILEALNRNECLEKLTMQIDFSNGVFAPSATDACDYNLIKTSLNIEFQGVLPPLFSKFGDFLTITCENGAANIDYHNLARYATSAVIARLNAVTPFWKKPQFVIPAGIAVAAIAAATISNNETVMDAVPSSCNIL